MADEFEQFRKRSYHGGYDMTLSSSETCQDFGRTPRGPPLKRSRSHPVGTGGKPRRALRPTTRPAIKTTAPEEDLSAQEEVSPSGRTREHNPNLLSPRVAINSALHSSLHSLVLLPKINEYVDPRVCGRRAPHHVRVFPTFPAPRCSRNRNSERRAAGVCDFSDAARRGTRTPRLKHRTASLQTPAPDTGAFSVRVLGQLGVGKATLMRTFAAADDAFPTPNENEDYSEGASVSVLQHGKEDLLLLSSDVTTQVATDKEEGTPHAYVIVYAVNDKQSFEEATKAVKSVRAHSTCRDVPVVLVANKGDMVRSRVVKTKVGRDLAARHRCKYLEVSALLNINVDELFLGVLTQLHFSRERVFTKVASESNMAAPAASRRRPIIRAMGYLGKLFAKYREYDNDIDDLFSP